MATIQIAKTKGAGTVTETAITQRQSLEVVQTMLHSAFSSITFLRGLFPEKAYEEQTYKPNGSSFSYEDYLRGDRLPATSLSGERETRATKLQVLQRARSRRVDLFLDWLENGAFSALKARDLSSLEIVIHPGLQSRDRILESYTFEIAYTNPSTEGTATSTRGDSISGTSTASIGATHNALRGLLRDTMKLCQNLPHLPPDRSVSMTLTYIRGPKKEPKYFISNDDAQPLLIPHADQWEMKDRRFGAVSSNYHDSSFRIAHLQPVGYVFETYDHADPPCIPAALEFFPPDTTSQNRKRRTVIELADTSPLRNIEEIDSGFVEATPSTVIEGNEIEIESVVTATGVAGNPKVNPDQHVTEAPSPTTLAEIATESPIHLRDERRPSRASQRLFSQIDSASQTQSSNIPEMRSRINSMMQPEYFTQGDTQTQAPFAFSSLAATRSQTGASRRPSVAVRSPIPTPAQTAAQLAGGGKKPLSQKPTSLAESAEGSKDVAVVACQCSHNEEEDEMVQCAVCQTWQHLHCYGFTNAKDRRLPEKHACYECLFGGTKQSTLAVLKDLAIKRRAMHIVLKDGLRTQKELAQTMQIDTPTAKMLHNFMKNESYVVPVSGSRTRGFAATGKPSFVPVTDGLAHEKMLTELFNPLLYVSNHHKKSSASATFRPASGAKEMPPPATPATRSQRKRLEQTPGSGLDLRRSSTPFGTPRRPSSPLKRRFEEDPVNEDDTPGVTPGLRQDSNASSKRFKSVRTEVLIDANGLSSPVPYGLDA